MLWVWRVADTIGLVILYECSGGADEFKVVISYSLLGPKCLPDVKMEFQDQDPRAPSFPDVSTIYNMRD